MLWKRKNAKKAANVAISKGPWIWPLLWILAAVPIFFIYVGNDRVNQSGNVGGVAKSTEQMFADVCRDGPKVLGEPGPGQPKNVRQSFVDWLAPIQQERATLEARGAAAGAAGQASQKSLDPEIAFDQWSLRYVRRIDNAKQQHLKAADKLLKSIAKVCPADTTSLGIVGKFVLVSDFATVTKQLSEPTISRWTTRQFQRQAKSEKLDEARVNAFVERINGFPRIDDNVFGSQLAFYAKTYFDDWRGVVRDPFSPLLIEFTSAFAAEHSQILSDQLGIAWQILLVAFIPGIAGMIYRRAFWWWTMVSFVVILALYAKVASASIEEEQFLEATIHTVIALQLVLLLIIPGLRRYANSDITLFFGRVRVPALLYNFILGVIFLGPAIYFLAGIGTFALSTLTPLPGYLQTFKEMSSDHFDALMDIWKLAFGDGWVSVLFFLEVVFILLPFLFVLLRRSVLWSDPHPKNIVVCFDGTTNTPDQYEFGQLAQTNVYKLFDMLKADERSARTFNPKSFNATISKRYENKQIAFYYSGVGNRFENNPIVQVLGGATGMGSDQVVERAYLDVMRVYNPGDRIFVFGFSRGGAIARLFSKSVEQKGSLRSALVWRIFGRNLTLFRRRNAAQVPIAVLGCWDTVGSFGIAKTIAGIDFQKIDLFKDLTVANNVTKAYHLVALDERRKEFRPTLMDPDPTRPERIIEVWFSGDHANIGGGWATTKLSDVTLDFMLKHVSSGYAATATGQPGEESWGIYLSAVNALAGVPELERATLDTTAPVAEPAADIDGNAPAALYPDAKGQLRQWNSELYEYIDRELPYHAVISETVFERMQQASPLYAPQSLFNHHRDLHRKRETVSEEINSLANTQSVTLEERDRILRFRDQLNVTRFSEFLANLVGIIRPRTLTTPAEDLDNGFHGATRARGDGTPR